MSDLDGNDLPFFENIHTDEDVNDDKDDDGRAAGHLAKEKHWKMPKLKPTWQTL